MEESWSRRAGECEQESGRVSGALFAGNKHLQQQQQEQEEQRNDYNKNKSQLQASGRRRRVGSNIKKHRRLPLSPYLSLPLACCNICFDIAPPKNDATPVSPSSPCDATLVQLSVSRSVIQSLCPSIPLLLLLSPIPTINFLQFVCCAFFRPVSAKFLKLVSSFPIFSTLRHFFSPANFQSKVL